VPEARGSCYARAARVALRVGAGFFVRVEGPRDGERQAIRDVFIEQPVRHLW